MSNVKNIGEIIETGVRKIVDEVEQMASFSCVGPAGAYFEIPVGEKFGGYVRGVYRSYVCSAPTINEAMSMIRDCIVDQIEKSAGRSQITSLYWRNEEKIEVSEPESPGLGWRARTRLTVLPEENMT